MSARMWCDGIAANPSGSSGVRAAAKDERISPQKVRLVIDQALRIDAAVTPFFASLARDTGSKYAPDGDVIRTDSEQAPGCVAGEVGYCSLNQPRSARTMSQPKIPTP
jgi:hypothetical protein